MTICFNHFTFSFPVYFSVPKRLLCFLCFIHFNFIVFLSHSSCAISSRTNTNSSFLESFPCSVVPHFVLLHFITRSGKATFRTRLQRLSSCCCLRQYTTADCVCQDIHRSCTPHIFNLGDSHLHLLTPTHDSHHHVGLCPCCWAGFFLCFCFFMSLYVFL